MSNYYKVLAVEPDASFTAIYDAYEKLKRVHAGDSATLERLKEAYTILANPLSRPEYDRALAQSSTAASPAASPSAPAKQESNRRLTQIIDAAPPPRAARPRTEMIDAAPPPTPSGKARPRTEIIDHNPTAGHNGGRPPTEVIDYASSSGPAVRPRTELIDNDPPAAAAPGYAAASGSAVAPAGVVRIIVTENNNPVAECTLDSGSHIIGRPTRSGEAPGVTLDDRFVSRKHAVIDVTSGSVTIQDAGSLNGTRLNGERLQPGTSYPLHDHAVIQIEHFVLIVDFGSEPRP